MKWVCVLAGIQAKEVGLVLVPDEGAFARVVQLGPAVAFRVTKALGGRHIGVFAAMAGDAVVLIADLR